MTSRKNNFGWGAALSLASVCLTFTVPALAQGDDPDGADTDSGSVAGFGTEEETDADAAEEVAEESDYAAEEEPEEADEPAEAAKAPPPSGAAASVEGSASLAGADLPAAAPDESKSGFPMLAVVQLPGSGYPAVQVRGITNGSLWRTFHGMQWPYMPTEEKSLQLAFSGYYWNDLSNTRISVDESLAGSNINDQNRWATQSRGVIRVTPTLNAGDGWFAQGNAEIVVAGDMQPDLTGVLPTTDDLWVRAGKWNLFDVTVGRFQGWEIANHYGMALDLNTLEREGALVNGLPFEPTDGYGLSYFWDRQNFRLGGYAVHVYPTDFLRFELLSHLGAGNGNAGVPYQVDVRPAAIFDIGFLKLKAGWEYGEAKPQDSELPMSDKKNGYGFAAQVVLDPYVEFGGSFARGFQDLVDKDGQADLEGSNTVQTFGGFLNGSPGHEPLVIGVGAFLKSWENFRINQNQGPLFGKVDTNEQRLLFAAVQYTLWERLNIKFVLSHARNTVKHYRHGDYVNDAVSGRLRAEFLF